MATTDQQPPTDSPRRSGSPKRSDSPQRSGSERAGGAMSFVDPRALMRIKSLQLRAKVVVEGFNTGLHRSPYHGFSVEFSEYRQYTPGDDPRYIDWRLYARSDRYYIKRFEDETSLRCHLLVDMSRSMSFGSGSYTKAEYARTLAATMAYFLASQRDAVGLLTFDEKICEYLPARFRPGHLHRLMLSLERLPAGVGTDLSVPLEQIASAVNRRGLIVLISDLLAPIDSLETNLSYLRSRGHEVILLRVLDRSEQEFDFGDASIFHDLESGRELYIDPKAAREQYLERFAEHSKAIQRACNNLGIELVSMTTDRPLELALFDFVSAHGRRGRQISRRSPMGRRSQA